MSGRVASFGNARVHAAPLKAEGAEDILRLKAGSTGAGAEPVMT